MSGHIGGGPSYLCDLNMLPEEGVKADAKFDPDDLSLYTNTQFFEFDVGEGDGEQGSERFTVPEEAQLKNGHLGFLNGEIIFYPLCFHFWGEESVKSSDSVGQPLWKRGWETHISRHLLVGYYHLARDVRGFRFSLGARLDRQAGGRSGQPGVGLGSRGINGG